MSKQKPIPSDDPTVPEVLSMADFDPQDWNPGYGQPPVGLRDYTPDPHDSDPRPDPEMFRKATLASIKFREVLFWIYEHLGDLIEDVDAAAAPSKGAYYHLVKIKESPGMEEKFYADVVGKLLPSKEEESRRFDIQVDEERVQKFIDLIKSEQGQANG